MSAEKMKNPMCGEVRVDCYVAVFDKFNAEYPDARFEVITRQTIPGIGHTTPSVLSPTWSLLTAAKQEGWSMDQYCAELAKQFNGDVAALVLINELAKVVYGGKDVFLVCFEKDPGRCHRGFVKTLVDMCVRELT